MAAVGEDIKARLTCLGDLWDMVVNIGSVRNISRYSVMPLVCSGKTLECMREIYLFTLLIQYSAIFSSQSTVILLVL